MTMLWLGLALLAIAALLTWTRRREARFLASSRLEDLAEGIQTEEDPDWTPSPILPAPRTSWLGGLVAAVVAGLASSPFVFIELAAAIGVLTGAIVWLALEGRRIDRSITLESRLADAIDLAVSGLRAGSSLHEALRAAAEESRGLLREALAVLAARLRLGERPQEVFSDFEIAAPVDSARLFSQTMSAQWEAGGSVAPALGSVAVSVRQRIELARRVKSQSAEIRFSVAAVLAATYGIGLLGWSNAPDRVESFLASSLGGGLLAACVILQAVGLIWIQKLSKVDIA